MSEKNHEIVQLSLPKVATRLLNRNIVPLIAYVFLAAAMSTYIEVYYWHLFWPGVFARAADFAIYYVLLLFVMNSVGYSSPAPLAKGFGLIFLSILITIPVTIGFFLLIAPGVYLMAKWLPAQARYVSGQSHFSETMSWSWRATGSRETQHILLVAIGVIPALCSAVLQQLAVLPFGLDHLSGTALVYGLARFSAGLLLIFGVASLLVLDIEEKNAA